MEDATEVLAVDPAQAQPDTASAEASVSAPVETQEDAPKEAPKTFTQEELDAAIGKRLAREQRKWEREQQQRTADAAHPRPSSEVTPDKFESTEDYVEALAEAKAAEKLAQRETQRQRTEIETAYHDREEVAREKYADFQEVAYNPKLPISDVMALSIQSSDIGPDIAYHLGQNPAEAARIARLAPFLQAKEIGRIEAKLAENPPPKKTTSAPAPISPVKGGGSNSPTYDTTDPRSTKVMTASEWIAAERARQRKNLEARTR